MAEEKSIDWAPEDIQKKDIIAPNTEDLLENLDITNPYPEGHICERLYTATSSENKIKMKKNIRVNAQGNIEVIDREYIVLRITPDNKEIFERNGKIYFCNNSDSKEAEKQWYTLFDTEEDVETFINAFTGKDDKRANKIGNMMRIFWLYTPWSNNWFWNNFSQEREMPAQWYAILGKTITDPDDNEQYKLWVKCYFDKNKKEFYGDTQRLFLDDGYPVIVSRSIIKQQ